MLSHSGSAALKLCWVTCRAAIDAYIERCQETLAVEDERGGGIEIGLGENDCPAALLYHPRGYSAVVSSSATHPQRTRYHEDQIVSPVILQQDPNKC